MTEKIIKLKQKRQKIVEQQRNLLDTVEEEKRDMTAEETEQYERMDADFESLDKDIQRQEALLEKERKMGEPGAEPMRDPEQRTDEESTEERLREAFALWLERGSQALTADQHRAMQADSDIGGGYLVAPQQTVQELLKEVDDMTIIRQYARIFQLTEAKSLGVPTLDDDADDWDWTAELKTGSETDIEFGKRELRPHPLAKRAKISNTLLRMASMGPEAIVRERLSYKLATTLENAYMTGNGVVKPLGLFVDSADGISNSRDESGSNTATLIKADSLIDVKYKLKGQYHARARWVFHRDVLKEIRKLKNGDGQYIWQPGIAGGRPDTILELPYNLSEFAPSTMSSGKYVGILGDFNYYWIVDSLAMQMQRLTELYAETNQTGFIGRYEGDGAPALEEAFVRMKMGS